MIIRPKFLGRTPPTAYPPNSRFSQNLVLLLGAGEGAGDVVHDHLGRNPGTFHGPGWTTSPFGRAALLDGSTSWIEVPASTAFTGAVVTSPGPVFSIAVWLKWHSSSETYGLVYGEEDAGTFNFALFAKSDGSQAVYFTTGNADPISGAPTLVQDQWTHLVLTNGIYGGTNYYVNGKLVNRFNNWTSPLIGNGNYRARICGGSIFGSGRFINGAVGPVAKWVRQLSENEVIELYTEPSSLWRPTRKIFTGTGVPPQNITGSAGIASNLAFGSTGGSVLNVTAITGSTGIPSNLAFGCLGGTLNRGDEQQVYAACGGGGIPSNLVVGSAGAIAIAPNLTGDAGIPSNLAMGANGSVQRNVAITGNYGIPSNLAFGSGAITMPDALGLSVFIGGVDSTANMRESTLNIIDSLSQVSTCSFKFRDPTGTRRPLVGQEVLVYLQSDRLFGGTVDESKETAIVGQPDILSDVNCSDFSLVLDRRVIGEYFPASFGTLGIIVQKLVGTYMAQDGFHYDQSDGDPGFNFGPVLFDWETLRAAFQRLANLSGWDFRIDPYKVLRFFPRGTGTGSAPFNVTDASGGRELANSMTVRNYRGKYRNDQLVKSSTQTTALFKDTFSTAIPGPFKSEPQPPDGIRIDFITSFGITATPIVKLNTNPQIVVSLDQISLPGIVYDWYWIPQQGLPEANPGVFQNQAHAPLTSSDTLEVFYQAPISPVTEVKCDAEIAARAAIEGNSGIYQDVQNAPTVTDPATLPALAQGLLNRFGCLGGLPIDVTYSTDKPGMKAGQLQAIQTASPLVGPPTPAAAKFFLVTSVNLKVIKNTLIRYQVAATSGVYQGDWTQFFAALIKNGTQAQPGTRMTYSWQLAPSYPGITNPGLSLGVQAQPHVIQNPMEILQFYTVWFPGTVSSDVTIDLLINGTGTGQRTYPAFSQRPQIFFFAQATQPIAGDVLQVYIVNGPHGLKDGIVTLVSSVVLT